MVSSGNQLIKDHYHRAIDDILSDFRITPWQDRSGRHGVKPNDSFTTVVQHTEAFLGSRLNKDPHYRYNRYRSALIRYMNLSMGRRIAHIDIGCGSGLFSWTLLDSATQNNIAHSHIDLYGYDHSPQMICLARMVRRKLIPVIPSYPDVSYTHNLETLLSQLKLRNRDTDYIITFGHVLAQSHAPSDIHIFTKIIDHIMQVKYSASICELLSVDGTGPQHRINSIEGWNLLLENLQQHNIFNWEYTPGGLMCALLTDNDEYPFP